MFIASFDKQAYRQFLNTPARQTGVYAVTVVLALLWQIKAGILNGLDIHILGVTACGLILGFRMGMLCLLLATSLSGFINNVNITEFIEQWLLNAILPFCFSYSLFLCVYRYLPRHFFIYIFICAFLVAGMTAAFKIALSSAVYFFSEEYTWQELQDNYLYFSVIMWFPEAMLNGMVITLMITYRPNWVKTFYDKEYLNQ
ncbi:hypothetical protein PALB_30460 [Pseudoalteromonas luteoviolacea B = ATCC 29581]|nr:hypothetical protein PALB_30460 [Pseudoalteromonas luteoviolacea B = ATCC 29581]